MSKPTILHRKGYAFREGSELRYFEGLWWVQYSTDQKWRTASGVELKGRHGRCVIWNGLAYGYDHYSGAYTLQTPLPRQTVEAILRKLYL